MKHSHEEYRRIAATTTILRCQVGSGIHGTGLDGQEDRDEMGICVEPPAYVIGLRRFEQYIHRTQPEGHPSGPGDLDLVVYSLRKWMRLALTGNPTVLLPLFVPDHELVAIDELGLALRARPELVLSRRAGDSFLGYLRSQREHLVNAPGNTKYAMHMVRLGVQGVELLETGRITLPVPEPWRAWLRELRRGERTTGEALEAAAALEAQLHALVRTSHLPPEPDQEAADAWLVDAYTRRWRGR